jgi:hypothetical protein
MSNITINDLNDSKILDSTEMAEVTGGLRFSTMDFKYLRSNGPFIPYDPDGEPYKMPSDVEPWTRRY